MDSIKTINLTADQLSIIRTVIWNLHDGIWKNFKPYQPFKNNIELNTDECTVSINISEIKRSAADKSYKAATQKTIKRYFNSKANIMEWFSAKATSILYSDLKDNYDATSIYGHEKDTVSYFDTDETYSTFEDFVYLISTLIK